MPIPPSVRAEGGQFGTRQIFARVSKNRRSRRASGRGNSGPLAWVVLSDVNDRHSAFNVSEWGETKSKDDEAALPGINDLTRRETLDDNHPGFFIHSERIMDLGSSATLDPQFLSGLVSIVLIDLLLAGDNAVVIAMAVRSLPKAQRRKGILFGASAAVLLRVIATFFVSRLLSMSFVKFGGGMVILWIAFRLFVEDEEAVEQHREAETLWHAVRLIVIADITMSLDNMLAVGGAAQGDLLLLLFGLGLSIPFIVVSSTILERLMERYPVIIYLGAALLGKVGGEMIMTDPVVIGLLHPPAPAIYLVEALCAAGVISLGRVRVKRDASRKISGEGLAAASEAPPRDLHQGPHA